MTAVVGLDLSLTATGIATPDGLRTVTSKGGAGASLVSRAIRLHRVCAEVYAEIARTVNEAARGEDTLVVIEAPAFSRTTGHQHDRSGLWWLVVSEIGSWDRVDVVEVQPTARAKYATGKGNAGKAAVVSAVSHRYGVTFPDDNTADAFVLRAMGLDQLGEPLAVVPKAHRAALAAVAWPEWATAEAGAA